MKRAELEKEILELKEKVKLLEARPTCFGHYCGCYHYNYPVYPVYPWYASPNICGTATGGLTDKNADTVTFGKVNS